MNPALDSVFSSFSNWETIKNIPEFNKISPFIQEGLSVSSLVDQATQRLLELLEIIHVTYKNKNDKIERKTTSSREVLLREFTQNDRVVKILSHEIHNLKTLGSSYFQNLVHYMYWGIVQNNVSATSSPNSCFEEALTFQPTAGNLDSQAPVDAWNQLPPAPNLVLNFGAQSISPALANNNVDVQMYTDSTFAYGNEYYPDQTIVPQTDAMSSMINYSLESSAYYTNSSNNTKTDSSLSTSSDIPDLDELVARELLDVIMDPMDESIQMDVEEIFKKAQLDSIATHALVVDDLIGQINEFDTKQKYAELDSSQPTMDRSIIMQRVCSIIQTIIEIFTDALSTDTMKHEARGLLKKIFFHLNKLIIVQQPNQKGKRIIQYQQNFPVTLNLPFTKDMIRSIEPVLNISLLNQDELVPGVVAFKRAYKFDELSGNICGTELMLTIPKNPISLEKSKSGDMKSVKEENFWMKFSVYLFLKGYDEPIEIEAKSLPFKIIVAVTQRIVSFPTLIYDNACQLFDGKVYDRYRQSVRFQSLITATRTHFPNLQNVIKDKDFVEIVKIVLSKNYFENFGDPMEKLVSVNDFFVQNKVKGLEIAGKENKISVWEWIFYLDEFIEKHLNDELIKRNLVGYLNKNELSQILGNSPNGTFLIRFSNSTPNAVTVEWIGTEGWNCYRGSQKDLDALPLINRIRDTPHWRIHYPTRRSKELVFSENPDPSVVAEHETNVVPVQNPRCSRNFMKYIPARLRMYFSIRE